jgi:hypothetical protein
MADTNWGFAEQLKLTKRTIKQAIKEGLEPWAQYHADQTISRATLRIKQSQHMPTAVRKRVELRGIAELTELSNMLVHKLQYDAGLTFGGKTYGA